MDKIFTEENGYYSIDCSNAVWIGLWKQKKNYFSLNIRMQR